MASPVLPWKTKIILTILSAVTGTVRRPNGTINHRLLKFLEVKAPANNKPVRGVKTSDVTVNANRNLWFCLFTPTETSKGDVIPLPVVIFFHDGGFSLLTTDSKGYDEVCRQFAIKFQAFIVSVNYCLTPEHQISVTIR
ncbi:probable carboxylesterase 18 [Telopea speciosissima]|uniref:probable carboxylesterase 18 n=1 Tax=Telopea speciosissima TaxID=54955 RepID=UPI001CC3B240|nr:probable carboxylesterase 18 [Telopea speciosissima]